MQKFHELKVSKFSDCFGSSSLATYRKYQGDEERLSFIRSFLRHLESMMNVTKQMTDAQVNFAAELIADGHYAMTIADLKLFVKWSMKQKVYNRLDAQVLTEWIEEYWAQRSEAAAYRSQVKHNNDTKPKPLSVEAAKRIAEILPEPEKPKVTAVGFTFEKFMSDKSIVSMVTQGFKMKMKRMIIDEIKKVDDRAIDFHLFELKGVVELKIDNFTYYQSLMNTFSIMDFVVKSEFDIYARYQYELLLKDIKN